MQEIMTDWTIDSLLDFGKVVSYGVSWLLVFIVIWGVIAFYPKKNERSHTGPGYLILAIWLGFLAVGLNALYWRVFGDLAVRNGWLTIFQLRNFGNSFGDIIWKGLGVVSIYLHFFARWKSISVKERKHWTPLMMGFYPNSEHFLVRTLTFWKNKARDNFYRKREKRHHDREDT